MLMDVGLSELEARIYIVLLQESGLSGYRIAKTLGKTIPNVYRAIHSLRSKGAIVLDDSTGTELYSALTLDSFLQQQRVALDSRIRAVQESFVEMQELPEEQGIFRLENIQQVVMKTTEMLDSAAELAVVIADPLPLGMIQSDLEDAGARGIRVLVRSYFPVSIDNCEVYTWIRRTERKSWPGQWLNVVVDGSQLLTAFILGEDRVANALWTNNRYLSLLLHHGMSSDIILGRILSMVHDGVSSDDMVRELIELTERHVFSIPHETLLAEIRNTTE
jgi:sugar-specific transcriptional regulator TrmB